MLRSCCLKWSSLLRTRSKGGSGPSTEWLGTTYPWRSFKSGDSSFTENLFDDIDCPNEVIKEITTSKFQPESGGRDVFVIQPFIKWGPKKRRNTTPQLQLEESVSLVNTLRDWTIRDKEIVSLYTFDKYTFFGSGKLDELKSRVNLNRYINSLFVSVNMLSPAQHSYLEEFFSVPVYDRYLIVMQIFQEHATSREAKLQIALAELPYMYRRMSHLQESSLSRIGGNASRISGTTIHSPPDTKKLILHKYESRLRTELEKVRLHRDQARKRRKTAEHPVVAVIGYTNAGKTSLIKALTGSNKLEPQNYLFATLDVTFHVGVLPCNLTVFYTDTVGFVSDIPTELIEPFQVTLSDAMNADLIVHVQDISNPDWQQQKQLVEETLLRINVEERLYGNVICVGNKCDLISKDVSAQIPSNVMQISCTRNHGIDHLKSRLQQEIIRITGRTKMIIRVKTGGDEFSWLRSETAVTDTIPDPKNPNYTLLSVLITKTCLDKFKHTFICPRKSN